MSAIPAQVGAPQSPQVNLLPADVEKRRSAGKARRAMLAIVVIFTLMLGGVWYYTTTLHQDAQARQEQEESRTVAKQAELATYSYLPELRAEVDNAVNARAAAGSVDILWADQLIALAGVMPSGTTFENLTISTTTPSAPYTSDGGVFSTPDFGSISFQGRSLTPLDPVALQESLDALPGFERTKIDAVQITDDPDIPDPYWVFSGATRITQYALSGRTETTHEIVPVTEEPSDATTDGEG